MRILAILLLFASTAGAQHLVFPTYPTGEAACSIGTANQMACGRFVAQNTLTNATKLAINIRTGYGGSIACSVSVYPDLDGGTALATTGAVNCGTSGVVFATGLAPVTYSAGVTYRLCFCANATTGAYSCPNWVASTGFATLQNAFVASVGRSTNNCVAGAPPATTGALITDATLAPPLVLPSVE